MDWIEPFYRLQNAWTGVYAGEVSEQHRKRAARLDQLPPPGRKRILELGAGGGQAAAAAADLGHDVTAVERVEAIAQKALQLAGKPRSGKMQVVIDDFYQVQLEDLFDAVCYWDGFGVGTDQDQRSLMARVAGWLKPRGSALIEVYSPWYWARTVGREMRFTNMPAGAVARRYDFDQAGCRMIDAWWPVDRPEARVSQSLRCYAPAELERLLEGSGLTLAGVEPGGAVDPETGQYRDQVPLEEAMSYLAVLSRT